MDTNVEASVVINKLTGQIAQLMYDKAVLEAVNEHNQSVIESLRAQVGSHPVTQSGQPAQDQPQGEVHNITQLG